MPNILFVTDIVPFPLEHGMSLRAVNLARSLPAGWTSYLAHCGRDAAAEAGLASLEVFADTVALPDMRKPRSPLRVLRLDDSNLYSRFERGFARESLAILRDAVRDWSIDVVVGMNFKMADFVGHLDAPVRVVDECDCRSLTIERAERLAAPGRSPWSLLGRKITLMRIRRGEGALADACDLVTTVASPDAERLRELGPPGARIEVVPNGVSHDLSTRPARFDRADRAVAFWGNLDFDVNQAAIRHFHDEIFAPRLAGEGVTWHVVGKSPEPYLVEMAGRDDGLRLAGFVDDLAGYLEEIPLMVNPMVMGSGLKNKVLEAFSLGIVVVSTSMGVEALDVEHGVHCMIADDPAEFARIVLDLLEDDERRRTLAQNARRLVDERYSWSGIGSGFAEMVGGILEDKRAAAPPNA